MSRTSRALKLFPGERSSVNMVQNVNEDRYLAASSKAQAPKTLREVADSTDLNYWWLRRACSNREIEFTKVGREYCLTEAQIDAARAKRRIVIETDSITAIEIDHAPVRSSVRKPVRTARVPRAQRPPRLCDPAEGGLVVTDAVLGPNELNTYADRLVLDVGEGCIYVASFVTGMVKVGRSHRPFTRVRQHASEAERHENPVVRAWISMPHTEFAANERALKAWAAEHGELINGSEYFHGINAGDMVRFALTLPATSTAAIEMATSSPTDPTLRQPDKYAALLIKHDQVARGSAATQFQQGALDLFGEVA